MDTNNKFRRTYDRLLVVPFGRFRRHVSEEEPDKAVFVGRDGARSYLIDALTSNARRGAYLVTGRRGVGKTTFVENCVREANELKYRRYMRRSAGRTVLDQLVVSLFLLSLLLLLTVDLEILSSEGFNRQLLAVLLLPPTGIVVYSIFCFRSALSSLGYYSWKGSVFVSIFSIAIVATLFVNQGPLFSSSVVLSSLLFLGAIGNVLGRVYGHYPYRLLSRLEVRLLLTFVILTILVTVFTFIVGWVETVQLGASETHDKHSPYIHLKSFGVVAATLLCISSQIFLVGKIYRSKILSLQNVSRYIAKERVKKYFVEKPVTKNDWIYYFLKECTRTLLALALFICISIIYLYSIEWLCSEWSIVKWMICFTDTATNCQESVHPAKFPLLWKGALENPLLGTGILLPLLYIAFRFCNHIRKNIGDIKTPNTSSDAPKEKLEIKIVRPVEILLMLKALFYVASAVQIYHFLLLDIVELPGWKSHEDKLEEEKAWVVFSVLGFILVFCMEFVWIIRAFSRLRFTEPLSASLKPHNKYTHHNDHYWQRKYGSSTDVDIVDRKENSKFGSKVEAALSPSESIKQFRLLNRATFPFLLIRFWTPSLVVRINLGFDSLDHRSVIHAMLHSLRNAYSKQFVEGLSPYRLIGILVKFIVVLILVTVLSRIFAYPNISQFETVEIARNDLISNALIEKESPSKYLEQGKSFSEELIVKDWRFLDSAGAILPCEALTVHVNSGTPDKEVGEHFMYGLCRAMPTLINNILRISYTPIIKDNITDGEIDTYLKRILLHDHYSLPSYKDGIITQYRSINFRLFHIFLFILIYWLINPLLSKISPFPYKRNIKKIESLAESMISTSSVSEKGGRWSIGRLLSNATAFEKEETRGRSPLDSRSVELAFLTLLGELSNTKIIQYPKTVAMNSPAPDIIFIFDELDKIGGNPSAEHVKHALPIESISSERARSEALHELLSDMKRLISSAPSRFIFVGNRTLYDEYVADEGKREPLLTSIFDANIYLPSLLLDHSQIDSRRTDNSGDKSGARSLMGSRVNEYISESIKSAKHYNSLQRGTWNSMLHLFKGSSNEDTYKSVNSSIAKKLDVFEWSFPNQGLLEQKHGMDKKTARDISKIHSQICAKFADEFAGFLAYRSKGIPKKMGDIIAGYVRPTQRLYYRDRSPDDGRYSYLASDRDMLMFDYSNIYRVQFVNSLYQQLKTSFETQLLQRDDKVTIDVLYLFDFLLKFHGRAFSWSNLEHIDELAHIHKTPDLRHTIAEVLDIGVGRYFHPVLNGLYTYRFRTEFAAEVRHLSKLSEFEMAAFNFTLDESLALKTAYMQLLNSTDQLNEDLMVALGELHEYDQEYELARGWYYSALFSNDREFSQYVGDEVDVEDIPRERYLAEQRAIGSISTTDNPIGKSIENAAGISSPPDRVPYVKAILHGDTEAVKDLKVHLPWATRRIRLLLQIGLTYEQTYDLERARSYYFTAHRLSRTMTQLLESRLGGNGKVTDIDSTWFAMACDHLEVLYQPAFAAAWIAEKSVGSIDGSIEIVELELHELHERIQPKVNIDKPLHGSLSSLNNQLHGALFKNFAMLGAEAHNKAGDLYFFKGRGSIQQTGIGYQHFARKHYSSALMLVAGYMRKTDMLYDSQLAHTTGLPSFISQLIYSNIVDISETTLAQLSILKVMQNLYKPPQIDIQTDWNFDYFGEADHSTFVRKEILHLSSISISQLMLEAQSALSGALNHKIGEHGFTTYSPKTVEGRMLQRIDLIEALVFSDDYENLTKNPNSLDGSGIPTLLRCVILSMLAAGVADKTGLKRASIAEYIMVLEMIEKVLKWIRMYETETSLNEEGTNEVSPECNSLVIFLGRAAEYALAQVEKLYYRYRGAKSSDGSAADHQMIEPDERLQADAATQGCGILLSLSQLLHLSDIDYILEGRGLSISGANPEVVSSPVKLCIDLRNIITRCFEFDRNSRNVSDIPENSYYLDAYDFEGSNYYYVNKSVFGITHGTQAIAMCEFRKFARSRLIYLNDRYCFPFLGTLMRLKLLSDDIFISEPVLRSNFINSNDGSGAFVQHNDWTYWKRIREAKRWSEDFIKGAERFDNPSLMTNLEMAENCFLKEYRNTEIERQTDQEIIGRNTLYASTRYAAFAEQSFTMGTAYYKNIKRMMYLFDDFNDRKMHFKHALQMAGADVVRQILDKRKHRG